MNERARHRFVSFRPTAFFWYRFRRTEEPNESPFEIRRHLLTLESDMQRYASMKTRSNQLRKIPLVRRVSTRSFYQHHLSNEKRSSFFPSKTRKIEMPRKRRASIRLFFFSRRSLSFLQPRARFFFRSLHRVATSWSIRRFNFLTLF